MKQKLRKCLYMAGLLCISVSCKEKLNGCDFDALCCDTVDSGYGLVLVSKFDNAPADYGNYGTGKYFCRWCICGFYNGRPKPPRFGTSLWQSCHRTDGSTTYLPMPVGATAKITT